MLGHDERDALRHQTRDKGYVTREAVQFRHDNWAPVERRSLQRGLEVRPTFQRISALGRLNLGKGLDDLVSLGSAEALDGSGRRLCKPRRFTVTFSLRPRVPGFILTAARPICFDSRLLVA